MNACGYHGSYHFCAVGVVRFISRYQQTNDYCVGGKRVAVSDDGTVSEHATVLDLHAIYAFELGKHQEYVAWHSASPLMQEIVPDMFRTDPTPFDAGITRVNLVRP